MDELDKKINQIWKKSKKLAKGVKGEKCPEESMLASFTEGQLSEKQKERVENHLLSCSNCMDLVITTNKVKISEENALMPDPPANLIHMAKALVKEASGKRLFDIVLKFAKDTIEIIANPGNLGIAQVPAPIPVRGEKDKQSENLLMMNKNFPDIEAEIEVMKIKEKQLSMRVMVKEISSGFPAEGMRISLFNPNREIASHIARQGQAVFENLLFSEYVIKITKQGSEAGSISLNIQE